MDKLILSYQDSCLYESDLTILNSQSDWLNDRIISFYLEYLNFEIYESDEILFLGKFIGSFVKYLMQSMTSRPPSPCVFQNLPGFLISRPKALRILRTILKVPKLLI